MWNGYRNMVQVLINKLINTKCSKIKLSVQPEEVCRLYCRPTTSKIGYMLADKVLDGTKCGLNSFDICVNGICKPGGCDNRLESELVLGMSTVNYVFQHANGNICRRLRYLWR